MLHGKPNVKSRANAQSVPLYMRMLLLFLFVMVPVYILGTAIYLWGSQKMNEQLAASSLSQATLYTKTLESEIDRIEYLREVCINDEDLLYLVNVYPILSNYERMQYTLRAQKRLLILKNSSDCIQDITLHLVPIGKTITPGKIASLREDWGALLGESARKSGSGIIYGDHERLSMVITYPVIQREGRTPRLVLEITLSNAYIQKIMRGFDLSESSELLFLNTDYGFCISSKGENVRAEACAAVLTPHTIGTTPLTIDGQSMQATYVYSEKLGTYLVSLALTNDFSALAQKYSSIFFGFSITSVALICAFAYYLRKLVHQPMHELVGAFHRLEKGDFSTEISHERNDEFRYLYQSYNDTIRHLRSLIDEVYEQKIAAQRAELKQLQSQISPHFLYNSFYNIYRMAKLGDCESIVSFSDYLGKYYEYITRSASDMVMMSAEVEHAHNYLSIQTMRFQRIDTIMEQAPSSFASYRVPRLILQPLIENAFEHGIKNAAHPRIRVSFFDEADSFGAIVIDNGASVTSAEAAALNERIHAPEKGSETTGLINIHRRLQLTFGVRSGLMISRAEDGGFCVCMTITKEKSACTGS